VSLVSVERRVQAPQETVFDHVATRHFENHPRWDPEVLEMSQISSGPVGVGTTARVIRRQGSKRVEGTATVTEYQPSSTAAWDVHFDVFRLRQRVEVQPVGDGAASLLRLEISATATGPARFLLPLMRPRFQRTMQRSIEVIASMVE
jgi:hypothetical protein